MIKNGKNPRHKLHERLDKHSQEDDSDRYEKTHALIISRGGLQF